MCRPVCYFFLLSEGANSSSALIILWLSSQTVVPQAAWVVCLCMCLSLPPGQGISARSVVSSLNGDGLGGGGEGGQAWMRPGRQQLSFLFLSAFLSPPLSSPPPARHSSHGIVSCADGRREECWKCFEMENGRSSSPPPGEDREAWEWPTWQALDPPVGLTHLELSMHGPAERPRLFVGRLTGD